MIIRRITQLFKVSFPKYFIFFDTESNIISKDVKGLEKHTLKLGVCIFVKLDSKANVVEEIKYYFKNAKEFWNFVLRYTSKDRDLYIVAHNVKYDIINVDFMNELNSRNWSVNYPIMSGAFIMSAYQELGKNNDNKKGKKKKQKKITIIDSANFLKTRLAEIGKKLGIEKMAIDFDNCTEEELYKYCENDVIIVYKFIISIIKFIVDRKLGSFKETLASTAFNVWRKSFNELPIYYHNDSDLIKFERKAYKGGRVECFHIGRITDKTYYLDINSMYPYVMQHYRLPNMPTITPVNLEDNFSSILEMNNTYFIAECLIETDEEFNPYSFKDDSGKLLFPKGKFKCHLHDCDLRYAIKNNHLKKIIRIQGYSQNYCLRDYVNYFYPLKAQAENETDRLIIKLFLNSLYGRLGMRHPVTDEIEYGSDELFGKISIIGDSDNRNVYHIWNGKLYRSHYDYAYPRKNINVAIAGAVTSYSRMLLFNYIKLAGHDNTFYCDTDSLFVNEKGYNNLLPFISKDKLGYLKLENISDDVNIIAPKNYQFGDIVRSKGIPYEYDYDRGVYSYMRFTSIKDYINSGGEHFGRIQSKKKLSLNYTKGIVTDTGRVKPHSMNMT